MATDIERLAVLIEANTKSYERSMAKLQKDTERAFRGAAASVKGMDGQLNRIAATARTVGSVLGISLGIGLARQIGVAIGDIIKDVSELVDTADKLGVTTKQLQELNFAAGQTGVDFSELSGALSFFNKQIGEASRGGGDLLNILKANNVAIRDQAGNLLEPMELLARYADLVANAASAQDKATLVTKAFGKSSDELINTLSLGSAGLRDYADQAAQTGQIIEDELLRKGEALGDEWDKITGKMAADTKVLALSVITDLLAWGKAIDDFIENSARKMGLRGDDSRFMDFGTGDNGSVSSGDVMAAFGRANPALTAASPKKTIIPDLPQKAVKETDDALKALIKTMDEGRETARGFLGTFVDGLMQGEGLIQSLGDAFENLAQRLINTGLDQMVASLFGATGSAIGGPLTNLFAGLFAEGGKIGAGQFGIVGERGPEIVTGPASVTPMAANMNQPAVVIIRLDDRMLNATIDQRAVGVSVQIQSAHDRGMQRRQALAG